MNRELLARALAFTEFPFATAQEQDAWVDKNWKMYLPRADRMIPQLQYETTGYIEPLDRPRPPKSTGNWDDVWKRSGCPSISIIHQDPMNPLKHTARWSDGVETTIEFHKTRPGPLTLPGPTELFVLFSQERFKDE